MASNEYIEWTIGEYGVVQKSADWYWALGIIAVAAAVAAILFGNLLFAILIGIGAATLALYAARPPQEMSVRIDRRGITIGRRRYPFDSLESFYIIEEDEESNTPIHLIVDPQRPLAPLISLPLPEDADPEDVREFLLTFLPERERAPSLIDQVVDAIGI